MRRSYVDLPHGQLHVAVAGIGRPIVLLHQTPRSIDEYRDVMPLLAAAGVQAIAVDTPGYGASDPVPEPTIETLSAAIAAGLHESGVTDAVVVGHHTGGVLAVEMAATCPELTGALVLSSTPLVDAEFRHRPAHGVDEVEPAADGTHLVALWNGRASFYPADRPDLLARFARDALTAGLDMSARGHRLVREYAMERRLPLLQQPVLLIGAPDDPFGYPNFQRMRAALPRARTAEIAGGMVPLPDQCPDEYARLVADFARGSSA